MDDDQDAVAAATVGPAELIGNGFRRLERCAVALRGPDGRVHSFQRDVLRSGMVVGVLPVDRRRQEIVLIRQFRLAAALAVGRGDMVEIVAGRLDPGEDARAAAQRECEEETGVAAQNLREIARFMPAPALTDEIMTLFVADVDAATLPRRAGLADEHEFIRPFALKIEVAIDLLARGCFLNAPLLIALHWLRANRDHVASASA